MEQNHSVLRGRQLEDEFCSIASSLGGDIASRVVGDEMIKHSPIARQGKSEPWSMAPKIFDAQGWQLLKEAAQTMYGIMETSLEHFIANPTCRDIYRLPKQLEEIVLSDKSTPLMPPVVRIDIFFNEQTGSFKLCETNADGSAGFAANDFVTQAITASKTYDIFKKAHPDTKPVYLSNVMVDAVLDCYAKWARTHGSDKKNDSTTTLALVDYLENIEQGEAVYFSKLFEQEGIRARLTDVRDLHLKKTGKNNVLYDKQGPIDIVYKRVVTKELAEKPCSGADALVEAMQQDAVCTIGNLISWPVATKSFFAALHSKDAESYLTSAQLDFIREHVPETHVLDNASNLAPFKQKELWIVKPADGYNAVDVTAGADVSDEQWKNVLIRHMRANGVIQRYANQYATPVIPGHSNGIDPTEFPLNNNMLGLFVINGVFAGVFSRCGQGNVIGEAQGRLEQGVLLVG